MLENYVSVRFTQKLRAMTLRSSSWVGSFAISIPFCLLFVLYTYSSLDLKRDTKNAVSSLTTIPVPNPQQPSYLNDDEFMEIMKVRQHERVLQVRSVCTNYEQNQCLGKSRSANIKSLYSKNYNYTICRMQKVASSNWLRAVLVMDGFYSVEDALNQTVHGRDVVQFTYRNRQLSIKPREERNAFWETSLNIITVRNPFHRVVSAYREKFLTLNRTKFSENYHKTVANEVQTLGRVYRKDRLQQSRWFPEPTFEDFVNFLVRSKSASANDIHWLPFTQHCEPCIYDYDVIVKLETLDSDMRYLRKLLNVPHKFDDVFLMPKKPYVYDVGDYFQNLDPDLVAMLYKRYEQDFKIFGYAKPDFVPNLCPK